MCWKSRGRWHAHHNISYQTYVQPKEWPMTDPVLSLCTLCTSLSFAPAQYCVSLVMPCPESTHNPTSWPPLKCMPCTTEKVC
jgi:hypothetical protein